MAQTPPDRLLAVGDAMARLLADPCIPFPLAYRCHAVANHWRLLREQGTEPPAERVQLEETEGVIAGTVADAP